MTVDFTLVLVILNFILLMIVLNQILYKPLKMFLSDRQKQILADIDEAKESIKKAEALAKQREEELKLAMDEARKLKESIKVDAEKQAEKILEIAKNQEKEVLKQTEIRIQQEMKHAVHELQSQISEMVADLSAQFIQSKIDKDSDKLIIEKMIQDRSQS